MKRSIQRTHAVAREDRADTAANNFYLANGAKRRMESNNADKSTQARQHDLPTRQIDFDNAVAGLEAAMKLPKAPKTCMAVRTDGGRCKAQTLTGSDFCFFHHPGKSTERREARRKGGVARSRKVVCLPPGMASWQLTTAADVCELLGTIANQVLEGELDPKIVNSVAYIRTIALRPQVVESLA